VRNPLDRILAKGMQSMLKTIEEEMGKLMNQLLEDAVKPEMLTDILKKVGGAGMDFRQMAGMVGCQPGLDPYRVLGLDKGATDQEVKHRYSELLKKLHLDTSGTEGTRFLLQMVMAAYEVIKSERRWQR